jgi:hypothetical protein
MYGRCPDAKIDTLLETQFGAGRLYAAVSSRPGQVGRADGYVLEGKELEVGTKFRMWAGEVLMMPGYLVLLEETADREAEARVVIHGASGDHFSRGCDAGVCALDTKKMVAHVWTPRGVCCYW